MGSAGPEAGRETCPQEVRGDLQKEGSKSTEQKVLLPNPRGSRGKAGRRDPQRCTDSRETGAQKPGGTGLVEPRGVEQRAGQFPRTSARTALDGIIGKSLTSSDIPVGI